MPWTIGLQTLVLITKAVFIVERGQTNIQTRLDAVPHAGGNDYYTTKRFNRIVHYTAVQRITRAVAIRGSRRKKFSISRCNIRPILLTMSLNLFQLSWPLSTIQFLFSQKATIIVFELWVYFSVFYSRELINILPASSFYMLRQNNYTVKCRKEQFDVSGLPATISIENLITW